MIERFYSRDTHLLWQVHMSKPLCDFLGWNGGVIWMDGKQVSLVPVMIHKLNEGKGAYKGKTPEDRKIIHSCYRRTVEISTEWKKDRFELIEMK